MAQGQKWATEAERKAARKASRDKWLETHPKYMMDWQKANSDHLKKYFKKYCRKWRLKRRYDLSEEDYQAILKDQLGVCAICHKASSKVLHVDHNHQTGEVRGLLCARCNTALGLMGEDPIALRSMIRYLLWR